MENQPQTTFDNRIRFSGRSIELFVIIITNALLNLITLTLYYPWARVRQIKFFWENSYLNDTKFVFHGTGGEIFKGYIKVFAAFALFAGIYAYAAITQQMEITATLIAVFYFVIMLIIPVAVHGAFKYRMSRTSWRNVHFGYRGDRGQLIIEFLLGYLFTALTLGIYSSWFTHKVRSYIIGNIRFGSLRFIYTGRGFDLFIIQLKGIFLSIITFGIYYAWFRKNWINYLIDHIHLQQEDQQYKLASKVTGGGLFWISITNLILLFITFGIAFPWAVVRGVRYVINNIELPSGIDFDAIEQTENEYKDGTGEYLMDALDIGII
jgi:uncharacterized membrane protein YjgN (DUF898 family)